MSPEYFMTLWLLIEHHSKFLSLKGAAHACLSLHLSKCQTVGNHMSRLIELNINEDMHDKTNNLT